MTTTPLRIVDEPGTAPVTHEIERAAERVLAHGTAAPSVRVDPTTVPATQLALWSVADLMRALPGSSRTSWLRTLIPLLVDAGTLRKQGRSFVGRLADIERVLLAPPPPRSRRKRARER